jgi:hypothetical protein
MTKYEYKELTVKTKGVVSAKIPDTFISQLNELGKDGWKLVQTVPLTEGYGRTLAVVFIMRREITV